MLRVGLQDWRLPAAHSNVSITKSGYQHFFYWKTLLGIESQVLQSSVIFHSNEGTDFSGAIYQKVNSKLESAINVGWTSGTNATRFAVGAKYTLDEDSSLRAKVSNTSQVGIGFTHTLRAGKLETSLKWCHYIVFLPRKVSKSNMSQSWSAFGRLCP